MKKYQVLLILLGSLTGCATPKSPMPEAIYDKVAANAYGIESCGLSNRMELGTVAWGRTVIVNTVALYTFDKERMEQKVRAYQVTKPPVEDEWCKLATINILQDKQDRELRQQSVNAMPNSPSFTNCNTYFGQTFCTHY